jgi:hypothetical protein
VRLRSTYILPLVFSCHADHFAAAAARIRCDGFLLRGVREKSASVMQGQTKCGQNREAKGTAAVHGTLQDRAQDVASVEFLKHGSSFRARGAGPP